MKLTQYNSSICPETGQYCQYLQEELDNSRLDAARNGQEPYGFVKGNLADVCLDGFAKALMAEEGAVVCGLDYIEQVEIPAAIPYVKQEETI